MHRYNLRHGDINLNNILLQGRTFKLTDYFVDSAHGAPAYMDPEVVHGSRVLANDHSAGAVWKCTSVFPDDTSRRCRRLDMSVPKEVQLCTST